MSLLLAFACSICRDKDLCKPQRDERLAILLLVLCEERGLAAVWVTEAEELLASLNSLSSAVGCRRSSLRALSQVLLLEITSARYKLAVKRCCYPCWERSRHRRRKGGRQLLTSQSILRSIASAARSPALSCCLLLSVAVGCCLSLSVAVSCCLLLFLFVSTACGPRRKRGVTTC